MDIEVKNTVKPVDYIESMKILERRAIDVFMGKKKELLWILEHNTVYTAGSSSDNKDVLNKDIKVIKTNRGGKHTLHSPGQKVIYFVLNLNKRGKNIRKLISNVENCIINVLKEYNVVGRADKKNIGIWVKDKNDIKKIAAIGIKVKRWIAFHGFSINVSNDLSQYREIIPCGIEDKGISSLKEMNVKNYQNINKVITKSFLNIFL